MTMDAAQLSNLIQKAIDDYAGSLEPGSFADYIVQHVIEWQRSIAGMPVPSSPARTKDDITGMLADLRDASGVDRLTCNDLAQVIADLKATGEALQLLLA